MFRIDGFFSPNNVGAVAIGITTAIGAAIMILAFSRENALGVTDLINLAVAIGTFLAVVVALFTSPFMHKQAQETEHRNEMATLVILASECRQNLSGMQASLPLLAARTIFRYTPLFSEIERDGQRIAKALQPDDALLHKLLNFFSRLNQIKHTATRDGGLIHNGRPIELNAYQEVIIREAIEICGDLPERLDEHRAHRQLLHENG
jgi:hypothetical protein